MNELASARNASLTTFTFHSYTTTQSLSTKLKHLISIVKHANVNLFRFF